MLHDLQTPIKKRVQNISSLADLPMSELSHVCVVQILPSLCYFDQLLTKINMGVIKPFTSTNLLHASNVSPTTLTTWYGPFFECIIFHSLFTHKKAGL